LCSNKEGLDLVKEAIEKAGYTGRIKIGMDVAASEFYTGRTTNFLLLIYIICLTLSLEEKTKPWKILSICAYYLTPSFLTNRTQLTLHIYLDFYMFIITFIFMLVKCAST
jgi:hypothetical protein